MKYVEEVSISIHALLAESDPCAWYAPAGAHISIHALLAESDTDRMFCSRQRLNFYPRSPCGERHDVDGGDLVHVNFYPRSPCGERQKIPYTSCHLHWYFYPRSPCGERPSRPPANRLSRQFLSTLSLRRATYWPRVMVSPTLYFYPRSPCGERPVAGSCRNGVMGFLSTLSLRRATVSCNYFPFDIAISIHALLAESDSVTIPTP